jgi:hypothetical protein
MESNRPGRVLQLVIVIVSIVVGWVLWTCFTVAVKITGVAIPASMATTYSEYNTDWSVLEFALMAFFSWAMYQVLARCFLDRKGR